MPIYSLKERVFIVQEYFKGQKSVKKVQDAWLKNKTMQNGKMPTKEYILKVIRGFEKGSVNNLSEDEQWADVPLTQSILDDKFDHFVFNFNFDFQIFKPNWFHVFF